ncbi:MAG: hypothetical protein ACXVBX_12010, partial [Flavisolibacter sp.]
FYFTEVDMLFVTGFGGPVKLFIPRDRFSSITIVESRKPIRVPITNSADREASKAREIPQ